MQDFAVPPPPPAGGVAARNASMWFIPSPIRPRAPACTAVRREIPGCDTRCDAFMKTPPGPILGTTPARPGAGATIVEQEDRPQTYRPRLGSATARSGVQGSAAGLEHGRLDGEVVL